MHLFLDREVTLFVARLSDDLRQWRERRHAKNKTTVSLGNELRSKRSLFFIFPLLYMYKKTAWKKKNPTPEKKTQAGWRTKHAGATRWTQNGQKQFFGVGFHEAPPDQPPLPDISTPLPNKRVLESACCARGIDKANRMSRVKYPNECLEAG